MEIKEFYHPITFTLTYIVYDTKGNAIIIDPVLDYDPKSSSIGYASAMEYLKFFQDAKLDLKYILETHAHADHLTGAAVLKERYPVELGRLSLEVEPLTRASSPTLFRLRAGPFPSRVDADATCASLKNAGQGCFVVSP